MKNTQPEVAMNNSAEAMPMEIGEAKVKKEKVSKKIKKLSAKAAQLLGYIQQNQEDRNTSEVITEGVFIIFGGFKEIPDFTRVMEMTSEYAEHPEKAAKILAPLSPEKRAERKAKRQARLAARAAQ